MNDNETQPNNPFGQPTGSVNQVPLPQQVPVQPITQQTTAEGPSNQMPNEQNINNSNDKKSGLAIAGMVIGIIAILVGIVPFLGLILGIIAIIISIIAIKKKNGSKGMSITGIVTGAIAIITSIIATAILFIFPLFLMSGLKTSINIAEKAKASAEESAITEEKVIAAADVPQKKEGITEIISVPKGEKAIIEKDFEFNVNSVIRNIPDSSIYNDANELIAVNVTLKNIIENTRMFSDISLRLLADGIEYVTTTNYDDAYEPHFEGSITGGGKVHTGNIFFVIPKSTTDLKLQYTNKEYDSEIEGYKTVIYKIDF